MQLTDVSALARRLSTGIARVIIGKEREVELMLAALLAGGHVLLEDVPGTGKTVLARALSRLLDCAFSRVQCTPDLMPQDITGSSIYDPREAVFKFMPGPVFTGILLADELNRATPRTQSALLECMDERQVTFGGETHPLSETFFVIATQNPIEIQGTFPLPEAQLDRFLVRLALGYPTSAQSIELLERFMLKSPLESLGPVASEAELIEAQRLCRGVQVSESVHAYIVALAEKTRTLENVQLGVSTRGMLALMRCAQSFAAIHERDFVTPDDVKALTVAVFAHRLIVRGAFVKPGVQQAAVQEALNSTPVPTE